MTANDTRRTWSVQAGHDKHWYDEEGGRVVVKFLDVPTDTGLYVAYVDSVFPGWADKILLTYDASTNKWTYKGSDQPYRGVIHACLGPLPALSLTDE